MKGLLRLKARLGVQSVDVERPTEGDVRGGHVVRVHQVCSYLVAGHGEGPQFFVITFGQEALVKLKDHRLHVRLDVPHLFHHVGDLGIDRRPVVEEHRAGRMRDLVPTLDELGELSDLRVGATDQLEETEDLAFLQS